MTDELLTDQQQAERVRQWLRENGGFIFAGLLLGLGGLFGWNWWQDYQDRHGSEASAAYEQVMQEVRAGRPLRAAELQAELAADYGDSPYVDLARLALARLHMDRNETGEAAAYLRRVIEESPDEALRPLVRLRLARALLQGEDYEAALQALSDVDENSSFASRFHEVRGDIYTAMARYAEAREQYELALSTVEPGVIDRNFVQAKRDGLPQPENAAAPSGADEAPVADEPAPAGPPAE